MIRKLSELGFVGLKDKEDFVCLFLRLHHTYLLIFMKSIHSLLFIGALISISSCETPNKKSELVNVAFKKEDTCLVTYVLFVNLSETTSSYDKKYFRKALAYSIDRELLFENSPADYSVDEIYGDLLPGGPAIYGIVQPVFSEYNIKTIKGYSLNIDSAKYYFKKSKFSLGDSIQFLSGSICASSDSPTGRMKTYWHNQFGLNHIQQYIQTTQKMFSNAFSGECGLYFIPLINTYKEPEKYLGLFYSKNKSQNPYTTTKQIAYVSIDFDRYYEAGLNASNRVDAINNFKAAEQVLIDDAVIIPLWYGKRLYCGLSLKRLPYAFPQNEDTRHTDKLN